MKSVDTLHIVENSKCWTGRQKLVFKLIAYNYIE